jgi:hypothetical protein
VKKTGMKQTKSEEPKPKEFGMKHIKIKRAEELPQPF